MFFYFFFFKQKTAYEIRKGDWSSDVCSSDLFLKPVRKGIPTYHGALYDMVANPRSATVMGLLEEGRLARSRGLRAAQQAGSVKTLFGRAKDSFLGNF